MKKEGVMTDEGYYIVWAIFFSIFVIICALSKSFFVQIISFTFAFYIFMSCMDKWRVKKGD